MKWLLKQSNPKQLLKKEKRKKTVPDHSPCSAFWMCAASYWTPSVKGREMQRWCEAKAVYCCERKV